LNHCAEELTSLLEAQFLQLFVVLPIGGEGLKAQGFVSDDLRFIDYFLVNVHLGFVIGGIAAS